jgi:3-hexulose-6-phosphate synthase/6-phospho-3-hexuloisomerase
MDRGAQMGSVAERLCRCSSSSVFDAVDELGTAAGGALDGFRIFGGRARAAGPIETVLAEVAHDRTYPVEAFSIGEQIRLSAPGTILVVDVLGEPISSWGGLATRAAIRRGIPACVIRGGARDIEEIGTMDFLLAARHATPRTGKGRIRFVKRGVPLQWERVSIHPGDWLAVDQTGGVVIAARQVDAVARRAMELEAADSRFAQLLDEGVDFEAASRRVRHF